MLVIYLILEVIAIGFDAHHVHLIIAKKGGGGLKITLIRPCVTFLVVSFIMCMHFIFVVVHCLRKNSIKYMYIPHINLISMGKIGPCIK